MQAPQFTHNRFRAYLLVCILTLSIVSLHTHHFSGRNYRQDEAWVVHGVKVRTAYEIINWAINGTNPPGYTLLMKVWVSLFGDHESITRFSSTLGTAVALALVYRLGSDLFDQQTGLLSMFLLGTLPFFQFFVHEVRPYVLLIISVTAIQWMFIRWFSHPSFKHGVLFVLSGIAAIYTHFFGIYFVGALALFLVVFVRPKQALFVRTTGLFLAIGLSFLPWLLVMIQSLLGARHHGIQYALDTSWNSVKFLHSQMQTNPRPIGQLLLLMGLIIPVAAVFPYLIKNDRYPLRLNPDWRKWFLVAVPLTILLMSFVVNMALNSLTPRNLIIILPSLAILAAYSLRALPWQARAVILLLVTIPAVMTFQRFIANGPYREISEFMAVDYQPNAPILINAVSVWQHVPITYTVRERLPVKVSNQMLFHLTSPGQDTDLGTMPDPPLNIAIDDRMEALAQFQALIADHEQIWYIETSPTDFGAVYQEVIEQSYIAYHTASWGEPQYPDYRVIEYRRVPNQLEDIFVFGGQLALQNWTLLDSVEIQPCQSITLESWWINTQPIQTNYSLTMVMANVEGIGLARSDGTPAGQLTQLWQPGQSYLDRRALKVPCDTPPGEYPLLMGLYKPKSLEALPATLPNGTLIGDQVYLTTLFVRN